MPGFSGKASSVCAQVFFPKGRSLSLADVVWCVHTTRYSAPPTGFSRGKEKGPEKYYLIK